MKTGHSYFRIIVCIIAALVCILPERATAANDFLEEKQNYTVTPKGNGVLHFKIPIWSYGWQNNYRWGSPSVVWYSDSYHADASNSVTRFFNIRSTDKTNTSDPKVSSSAEVDLSAGEGTVKITRTADGGTKQINPGSGTQTVTLPAQTSMDGSYKRVVYIEFDWYLPENLTSKQFYVGIDYWLYKYDADDSNSGNQYKHIWYAFPDRMDGSDPLMAPELQSPYLYFMNDNGDPMRDGKAAIPYVVYQEPKSYTTSISPSPIMTNSRAGVIIVPTSDSIRRDFHATFTVQPNTDISTTTTRSTNKIDIPAFHRLYDFGAVELQDEHGSYNGKNILQWNIRNAAAEDLVATDYFEVQRATKQDFSDAQTITMLPMQAGKDGYQYEDDTRGMNAVTTSKDSSTLYKELVWRDYMLTDAYGEPMYMMDLRLIAKKQVLPASPLYYRVRRASTAAWEWNHPFAQSATLYKHSFLAPLADTQPDYTLDKDFSSNHLVHFNIGINNAPITESSFGLQDCQLVQSFTESRGDLDSIILTVDLDERMYYSTERVLLRYSAAGFERTLAPGKNVITMPVKDEGTLQIWVEITDYTAEFNGYEQNFALTTFTMNKDRANIYDGKVIEVRLTRQGRIFNGMWDLEARAVMYNGGEATYGLAAAQKRWEQVKEDVKQLLYDSLTHSSNPSAAFGRCMWDRGAQLILVRTLQETGATVEIIVPQDSIRRNSDGSWTAHATDVADMACTNYAYSVRIDPSNADLRFQDKSSEQPKAINGPSLYFNEAATITSFTATQGDATRERKSGVLLQWVPSTAAVDEYVLLRLSAGSTNAPDTVYRGKENNWFDTSAAPGVHYEYTIVARYECQGKRTDNSATAEGWRTPYGEISGYVRQTDNSGMSGVQVSLSAGSQTLRTLTTDAAGAYLFDSLEYGAGTQYVVSVTSQYGEFSYNGTKSSSATISLAADHCVQQGIEFVNTSCVRLSGRVLYELSTIPVSGVCFLLNGDTVKRGAAVYTSGIDGNFELTIPKSMPCRLQVAKAGHTFANDGWLITSGTDTAFSLVKALDGVRFYDRTKVRLVGRVAGGQDQQALPPALGFGKNNLGDDLQLVLQLEGDNTAHIVHDPDDLTRDTLHQATDGYSGHTAVIYEQKRILVRPDATTGEYAVDLFPVKYKVTQATATGYASLLDVQAGAPTFDLTNAPLTTFHSDSLDRHATYNARFDRIYRNPIQVGVQQFTYGVAQDGLGEQKLVVSSMYNQSNMVSLYQKDSTGAVTYLFGHPIFLKDHTYQFRVGVYEDYWYNNDKHTRPDRVRLSGGTVKVYNGFKAGGNTASTTYALDDKGEALISAEVDNLNLQATGSEALRTIDLSIEREGCHTDHCAVRGYITGNVVENGDIRAADADIKILDILRDPPGSGSSCYLEKGATYKSSSTFNLALKAGININFKIGSSYDQSVGIISVATYSGVSTSAGKTYSFNLPLVLSGKYNRSHSYTYTTTEKISTGSAPSHVGAPGDVFIGHANEVLYGTVRAIRVIDDSTYQLRKPAIEEGYIKQIASAVGTDGKTYHFVIAKETVLGTGFGSQFAYTQMHVSRTLLPKLIRERNALLIDAPDSITAQKIADKQGTAVYWNLATTEAEKGTKGKYKQLIPTSVSDYNEVDKVGALNAIILRWVAILAANEREKVMAKQSGKKVGTYSVSGGKSQDYSESFSADWTEGGNLGYGVDLGLVKEGLLGTSLMSDEGPTQYAQAIQSLIDQQGQDKNLANNALNEVQGKGPGVAWETKVQPVLDVSLDGSLSSESKSASRKIGFTIAPDSYAFTTVSVYRAPVDSIFKSIITEQMKVSQSSDIGKKEQYGSFVFFREGGSSHCPYEGEERTKWYYPGQYVLANATMPIEDPKIVLDKYSISNVPADQAAVFRLTLMNDNQNTDGRPATGQYLSLSVEPQTNPNGAIILIDGEPLTSASTLTFYCEPGEPIVKTMQVRRGIVDDYEDITIKLASTTCASIGVLAKFSVHFLPESTPVNIAYPRDNWVLNTLSSRDSTGYYLPISIDGFNIHHKNFDHIEFQYKLSTENNDAWVNQCSFYADDSLYNAATGNKAMIENGRITPFRFYGERDPKELSYDLRAVSFCRYGSGFVSQSSPVVSGTKDTRPPVLFGKATPANGILTLEDNIALRFSEPIAGNWLDEDNNFQVLGVTNTTGITQSTSPYFDGQPDHYAYTKAERELAITDLTIDMLIKPAAKGREMALLTHGDDKYNFTLSLTADNRLKVTVIDDSEWRDTKLSKPMSELSTTDFTRVVMVYDVHYQTVRFYTGTLDITDEPSTNWLLQNEAAPFKVGISADRTDPYQGNMMELRVWTKALTPAEISNTHMRHLSGYEYGLLDYYPMNESQGEELEDKATGATLFAQGLSWTTPQGFSLATSGEPVRLQPTLFSRTDAEDYTLLFWFRSNNSAGDSVSLFATAMGDSTTMEIVLNNNTLSYRAGTVHEAATAVLTDARWHHCALVISKTFNQGTLAIDGSKVLIFPALPTGALSGTNILMAKGLYGNIDDICLFEQALPDELVSEFGKQSPNGDEMGLINLLTFSELKRNSSNVMELVFSPNNRRIFKDANGNTVTKVQPLLVDDLSAQADKNNAAPVRDRGQLTRLPFTWNYQLSDLMINIKAQPREINKRTMYLTVRDVEDMNGNRLPSPVMWTVYADLNSVIWNERTHRETLTDELTYRFYMTIFNTTGITRQFTIEHLPDWLNVSPAQGTLEAKEEKRITFTINAEQMKIGTHHHLVYLTDDQGLAEPLFLEITKETEPPYANVDLNKYPLNMSLCGRVLMEEAGKTVINTGENDLVYAIYNNECVGVAHCTANGELYLTVHGDADMTRKPIRFQLWRADNGKTYNLTPSQNIRFAHGFVYGCGEEGPIRLTAGDGEMQTITLAKGWNWISGNLAVNSPLQTAITAEQPWNEGDLIKSPAARTFCTYSEQEDNFVGTLNTWDYRQMYMVYTATANTMHIFGKALTDDSMTLTLRGDGQWNVLPCLLNKVTVLRTALGAYYDHASTGDLIKAHNRFAVFSADKRWVGDLTALTPGEGYLFRRLGKGSVQIRFYNQSSNAPHRNQSSVSDSDLSGEAGLSSVSDSGLSSVSDSDLSGEAGLYSNPSAATNMTMIAKVVDSQKSKVERLSVFIGDELVGVASPISPSEKGSGDVLYFITIQSDRVGEKLTFRTAEGLLLQSVDLSTSRHLDISYSADAHYGTLESPVLLTPADNDNVYKIIEDEHVVIIRDGKRYDITGQKMEN